MTGRSLLYSSQVLMACAGLALGLTTVRAQSTGTLQGRVMDPNGAAVAGVQITAIGSGIGIRRESATDDSGRYQIASLPVGDYRIDARARGFQTQIVEAVRLEVGRTITQIFQLRIGDVAEEVVVRSNTNIIELATVSVGHMIDRRTVQNIPLNGKQHDLIADRLARGLQLNAFAGTRRRSRAPPRARRSGRLRSLVSPASFEHKDGAELPIRRSTAG